MNKKLFFIIILLFPFLQNCLTHHNYPRVAKKHGIETMKRSVTYRITGLTNGKGLSFTEEKLKNDSPFENVSFTSELYQKGTFIEVRIVDKEPDVYGLLFMALSVYSLTILPGWSTKDGYYVYFIVYQDGVRKKEFSYETNRAIFLWLPAILISPVNFVTPGEKKAFNAIINQFFIDFKNADL